jgi:NAD-dependent deacetylase
MDVNLAEAAEIIRSARHLLVFTGAGVSAESGIPTFRDSGGFWTEFPPEEYANWQGLTAVSVKRPRELARFLHAVIAPIANATPNAAHQAIADAESKKKITIVTQNVDGLHQAAGSTVVHEIHGSLLETVTVAGKFNWLLSRQELRQAAAALERAQRGILTLPRVLLAVRRLIGIGTRGAYRPKIVLFNEAMAQPDWDLAQDAAGDVDCLLQIGCSNQVYPAAELPDRARRNGATVIAVDPQYSRADVFVRGSATQVVPKLFDLALR